MTFSFQMPQVLYLKRCHGIGGYDNKIYLLMKICIAYKLIMSGYRINIQILK